jgi:excisionase family DNA binding protein
MTTSKWLTADEACERLRCSRDTLRLRLVVATRLDAVINIGSALKPRWRFDADKLDAWWGEACRALTATQEAKSCASDGATPTGRATRSTSPRRRTPSASPAKSKRTTASVARGSLASLARSLSSVTP